MRWLAIGDPDDIGDTIAVIDCTENETVLKVNQGTYVCIYYMPLPVLQSYKRSKLSLKNANMAGHLFCLSLSRSSIKME